MDEKAVFIDANVLLETVLKGRKYAAKAQQYISSHNVVISPLTAHLFVYLGNKDGLGVEVLLKMLLNHSFTDFGAAEVMWAINNLQGNDFEDALQVACAVTNGYKTFVTFDKKLPRKYEQFIAVNVL